MVVAWRQVSIAKTVNTLEGNRENCLAAGRDHDSPDLVTANGLACGVQRVKPQRSKSASTDPPP
jgi:hypothetical protein